SKGMTVLDALKKLMACPDLCSKRWIWEQYDSLVNADTAQGPGGDAAVVRINDPRTDRPTKRALAMAVDCSPRYCAADPVMGGAQAVAETYRNLSAVGAKPLAITDNMNFGNPEKPRIMGQFAGAVEGIRDACLALDYPVVSGNCSLYNETNGSAILPAPVIGGVGLLDDVSKAMTIAFKSEGEAIFVLGESKDHIGQSLYLREIHGEEDGTPPPVHLTAERRNGKFIRTLIAAGDVTACHDISDGGLLVALAEMALAGDIGCALDASSADAGFWFGEDQARYVVTAKDADLIEQRAHEAGIPALRLGTTGGAALSIKGAGKIEISALRALHEGWLPDYMNTKQ
ncbi:MAG TPA: AIR synthase related protein, partial [Alphaproteobacteria bacterium]|nr:AIR synthase related protein [Alphaproteobacteria bacterium]